jgi:peptide/nickel transport system substrate-binding protein
MEPSSTWSRRGPRALKRRALFGGLATGAAACGALFAAGCASNQGSRPSAASQPARPSGVPKSGGILTTTNRDNSPTLDTDRTTSGYTKATSSAILSRLLQYQTGTDFHVGENKITAPDLALTAESPDAVTWTLKLRPGVKFHNIAPVNGHAVEAEDILSTVKYASDTHNPARGGLDMVDPSQVQTPDSSTVVFKLKYPYAPFTSALASPNYFFIFPREVLAGSYDPAKQIIGSGPFMFDSYTPDVGFVLKKHPDYYQQDMPYLDGIHWNVLPDISQLRAQFTGAHLDVIGVPDGLTLPITDIPTLTKDNPKATVIKADPGGGQVVFYQLGDPASAFQDVRVRRAASLAVDRDAIGKALYGGDGVPQFCVILQLGNKALHMTDLAPDVTQYYRYDPAQVKSLLQAAGMADHQFKLVYFSGFLGPVYEQEGQTIANMMASAGFKITAVELDYQKDYIGGGKGVRYGNFDKDWIIWTGLSQYDDADEYMFNYFDSKTTAGLTRLNDPDLDAMITKARATVNSDEQAKAYLDVQKYIADKNYCLSGFPSPHVYTMLSPRVQNYQKSGAYYGIGTESYSKVWLSA